MSYNLQKSVSILIVLFFYSVFVGNAYAENKLSETFEGNFPSDNGWQVGDLTSDPLNNGYDYWDDTSYRSGWSAQVGSQLATITTTETIFTEGFEWGIGSWTVGDSNSNSGSDYWGRTTSRSYAGSYSAWVAQYGTSYGFPNTWWREYDNNMAAYMYRSADLSSYSSVILSYRYWIDSESCCDKLYVLYYDRGTWYIMDEKRGYSNGWRQSGVYIPTTATYVGFYFISNSATTFEGAYIDEIRLEGTKTTTTHVLNSDLHQYDDYMDAYMQKQINLVGYKSASLSYKYWLDVEDASGCNYDCLKVQTSSDGSNWIDKKTYSDGYDSKDGDSKARQWYSDSIDLTSYAGSNVYIRFLFHSDYLYHDREGAYLDDIKVDAVSSNYGASLSPPSQSKTVNVGEKAVYTFTIKNEGDVADTFSLGTTRGTLSTSSVSLNAGASTTFTLTDSSNTPGTYTATITATSQGDTSKKATATAVTTFVALLPDLSISSEDITFEKVG